MSADWGTSRGPARGPRPHAHRGQLCRAYLVELCRDVDGGLVSRLDGTRQPMTPGVLAVPTAFPDDVPTHGGQHRCPHCRQPLAIVVIPADAAIVRPPEAPPDTHNSANLNPPPGEDDLATLGKFRPAAA